MGAGRHTSPSSTNHILITLWHTKLRSGPNERGRTYLSPEKKSLKIRQVLAELHANKPIQNKFPRTTDRHACLRGSSSNTVADKRNPHSHASGQSNCITQETRLDFSCPKSWHLGLRLKVDEGTCHYLGFFSGRMRCLGRNEVQFSLSLSLSLSLTHSRTHTHLLALVRVQMRNKLISPFHVASKEPHISDFLCS